MRTGTLDTNVFPCDDLIARARAVGIDIQVISVSAREAAGSSLEAEVGALELILESAVWDESSWDEAMWSDSSQPDRLELILRLLSSGSFPRAGDRANLSDGQRRQLRDAMILEAHLREHRDVLISNDERAFVGHGRREEIEKKFATRIMTTDEFQAWLDERTPA